MKKLLLLTVLLVSLAACSKGTEGEESTPAKDEIVIPPTENPPGAFNETGGSSTVSFTAPKPWTASVVNTRADSWLEVTPSHGPAGEVAVTINAKKNDTPDERSASIVLTSGSASKTIQVTQKQKDALTLTASKFEVESAGGSVTVEVKSNVQYTYAISPQCSDWIKTSPTRALETTKVTFTVDPHRELEKREGTITFTDGTLTETVTIYQKKGSPQIVLSQDEMLVSANRSDIRVEVGANVNVDVSIPGADWIRENSTRSYSTSTYYFTVDENTSYDPRSVEIVFANRENSLRETVKVTQMQKDALVIAKTEYSFEPEGGNLFLELMASSIPVLSIECTGGWIQRVETRSLDNYSYSFNIGKLNADAGREGKLIFQSGALKQSVTIKQTGLKTVRERETQIMHDLYKALKINKTDYGYNNWDPATPVARWFGVEMLEGRITEIRCPEYESNLSARIHVKGHIPASLGGLTELKSFRLYDDNLALLEPIPAEIGNLKKLEELEIYALNIPGPIPEEIGELKNLKTLRLLNAPAVIDKTGYYTEFNPLARAKFPDGIGRLTSLETIEMHWLLDGDISPSIGNLKQLQLLKITQPGAIVVSDYSVEMIPPVKIGTIPEEIGGLENLEYLELSSGFSGVFPETIGKMQKLETIAISSQFLTGTLPENIGNLTQLQRLEIGGCKQMTGELPQSLGRLANLRSLTISSNGFTGPIPAALGNCKKLTSINFSYCDFTSFPASLSFLLDDKIQCCLNNDVGSFHIEENRMSGKIPDEVLNHPNFYLFAANFLMRQQQGYGFDLREFKYPACRESYTDYMSGKTIDFAKEYATNNYTLVFRYNYNDYNDQRVRDCAVLVNKLNSKHAGKGLKVICGYVNGGSQTDSQLKTHAQTLSLQNYPHIRDNMGYGLDTTPFFNDYEGCERTVPTLGLVDKAGNYILMLSGPYTIAQYDYTYRDKYVVDAEQFEKTIDNLMNR